MNPRLVELALRKQRLQLQAERQREDIARRMGGIAPAVEVVDHVRSGLDWIRGHAPLVAGAAALVAVLRPRRAWRLARRGGWLAWLLLRRRGTDSGAFSAKLAWPLVRAAAALLQARMRAGQRR